MKKIIAITGMLLCTATIFAQDLVTSQVPSVVLNAFSKEFPKAIDVEWERKGDRYQVEFDIGLADHEAWLDQEGKIVAHKEDIQENDLPAPVKSTIKRDFGSYRISDVEKNQTGNTVTYRMEAKNLQQEWEVIFDNKGIVIEKRAD